MTAGARDLLDAVHQLEKVELHQHVDGSIPPQVLWDLLCRYDLHPVASLDDMRLRLELQPDEEGSLLAYLDKFHYPLWITQFYENIQAIAEAIVREAHAQGVRTLELRYSPVIHTFAGLTTRQAIRAVLAGINRVREDHPELRCGLVVIAMRQHGPHIATILARQTIGEAEHLHRRSGVVGFDIAGPERGNPPHLFREAFQVARAGGLGITVHAGEDAGPRYVWEAVDDLGADRIGHGCSAVEDPELLRRLARDKILVECCLTSNYQTGAVEPGRPHPVHRFLEAGVPVALCTDNTTVSQTDANREALRLADQLAEGDPLPVIRQVHAEAAGYTFIGRTGPGGLTGGRT
jgi:adenosine deaminase